MQKVTVIIPIHNEENTIEKVINLIKKSKYVQEIIVVDNNSTDKTPEILQKIIMQNKDIIKVIHCQDKGKGYAMEKGMNISSNEIIVFLDGDIIDYSEDIVERLATPIINGEADFVKSFWERTKGGIITNIVAKPLLDIVFPEVNIFLEPLSGMIASKKTIFQNLEFEKNYGVDIAIVIDMILNNIKTKEVDIGNFNNISHDCKTQESIQKMSSEVMQAILKKAKMHNRI